jgi:hypothetical protein
MTLHCSLDRLPGPHKLYGESPVITMERGLRAPLSPNEELTLRRVALGIALAKDLPSADVLRLLKLALVEDRGEHLGLTTLGKERYQRFDQRTGSGSAGGTIDS